MIPELNRAIERTQGFRPLASAGKLHLSGVFCKPSIAQRRKFLAMTTPKPTTTVRTLTQLTGRSPSVIWLLMKANPHLATPVRGSWGWMYSAVDIPGVIEAAAGLERRKSSGPRGPNKRKGGAGGEAP